MGELADPGGDEGDREGELRVKMGSFQGGQPLSAGRAGGSWAHSQGWGEIRVRVPPSPRHRASVPCAPYLSSWPKRACMRPCL